jgi:sulfite reductase beta subunit-like hemoprotein
MHRSIGDSSSAKSWRTLAGISKYWTRISFSVHQRRRFQYTRHG